jgi:hypothetical protein
LQLAVLRIESCPQRADRVERLDELIPVRTRNRAVAEADPRRIRAVEELASLADLRLIDAGRRPVGRGGQAQEPVTAIGGVADERDPRPRPSCAADAGPARRRSDRPAVVPELERLIEPAVVEVVEQNLRRLRGAGRRQDERRDQSHENARTPRGRPSSETSAPHRRFSSVLGANANFTDYTPRSRARARSHATGAAHSSDRSRRSTSRLNQNTIVRLPSRSTRSSRCQLTARASTTRSMSRPIRASSSGV